MSVRKMRLKAGLLVILVTLVLAGAVAQETSQPPQDSGTGSVTEELQEEGVSKAIDEALAYINSSASYIGEGVVYVLNRITGDRVSVDLAMPVGYLVLITGILLLFGVVDYARRIIWIAIIVGWVLLVVRVVLDALQTA